MTTLLQVTLSLSKRVSPRLSWSTWLYDLSKKPQGQAVTSDLDAILLVTTRNTRLSWIVKETNKEGPET